MFLTGPEILKNVASGIIGVEPFVPDNVRENSLDVTLGTTLKVYQSQVMKHGSPAVGSPWEYLPNPVAEPLDPDADNPTLDILIQPEGYRLNPGVGYLASTVEYTRVGPFLPFLNGRSSWGRLFLQVHATAGNGETGFEGTWTLEMTVTHPLIVKPGVRIAQLVFAQVLGNVVNYRGKYAGQCGPTASRSYKDKV